MNIEKELKRLNFEDYIWIVVAILAFFNIIGDNFQKDFLKTNNNKYENNAIPMILQLLIRNSKSIFIFYFYLYIHLMLMAYIFDF